MGRLSQLGGAMLGAAVALGAQPTFGQERKEAQEIITYQSVTDVPTLQSVLGGRDIIINPEFTPSMGKLDELSPVLLNSSFFIVPTYTYPNLAAAMKDHYDLNLLIQSGASFVDYDVFDYLPGREGSESGHYRSVISPGNCNPLKGGNYSGYYTINDRKDVRFYVVDGSMRDDFLCPPELLIPKVETADQVEVVLSSPTPVATKAKAVTAELSAVLTPEYVPHPGRFADLEPLLVKQGIFLVPVREIGITEEVPAELSGTAYVTQTDQAKGKRVVYRQYVLDNYEPKTGTIRIHDGGNQEQCVETTSYQDKKLGNKTSYILSVPGSPEMREVECKEEAAPKPVVKTQVPTTVKALPQKSKSWKLPVRVGVGVGADREETSEYNLGDAPALHVSAQVQPFAIPLEFGISGDFIFTRDGSGLEGVDLMVGGQPFRAVPVRGYLTVGDSFEVRERYSETTLNGALSYGVLVEGDIYKFTLGGQALALGCNASAQKHLYGGGGQFDLDLTGSCGVAWNYVVSGGGREPRERLVASDAAVSAVAVEAQPRGPHLEMETKPYSYEIPVFKETKSEEKKASATQRSEAMIKKAQRNAWDGVEEDYNTAIKLKIPLSFKTYMLGAEAARALGNMQECYERILTARSVATTEGERGEADSFLADVAANYSSVEITVKAGGEISFVPSSMPFPPDQRAAVTFAQAELVDGSFEGFIPLILNMDGTQGTYTLNGQTIKFSDLKPVSDQVTTEIRLEK